MALLNTPAAILTQLIFVKKIGDQIGGCGRDWRLAVGSKGKADALTSSF